MLISSKKLFKTHHAVSQLISDSSALIAWTGHRTHIKSLFMKNKTKKKWIGGTTSEDKSEYYSINRAVQS